MALRNCQYSASKGAPGRNRWKEKRSELAVGERRKSSASMPMPERTEGVKAAGAELLLRPMSWLLGSMKNMG